MRNSRRIVPANPVTPVARVRPVAFLVTAALFLAAAAPAAAEIPPATIWVRSWDAPANHEDIGRFVATDTPDRIYVAGTTYEPGLGGSGHDFLLLRYDAVGNLVWYRRYGGAGEDIVADLGITPTGQVVITGYSPGASGLEVATVEYDPSGNIVWERRHSAGGANADLRPKLAIGPEGSVFVSASEGGDYLVLKYGPDGTPAWSRAYDGPASGEDAATDVGVDAAGNAFVTGVANSAHAFATVKFDASGGFRWEQIQTGDIVSVFPPSRVALGPDGDPVMAGNPESTCGVFQFKIWKCSADSGTVLWSDVAPDQPCSSLIIQDLMAGGSGEVLALCSGSFSGVDTHMQILRYAADGTRAWSREFDGPGTAEDIGAALAVDASGASYAVGYTTFPPQNRDYAAVKFSAAGTKEWEFTWASSQGMNDLGQGIGVDSSGDVILTGNSFDPAQNENVVTIKLRQLSAASAGNAADAVTPSLAVFPNPTFAIARIAYVTPRTGLVRLDVLDVAGRLARRLVSGAVDGGRHEISWDGSDGSGSRLPAGVYFLRLRAGGVASSRRIVLR